VPSVTPDHVQQPYRNCVSIRRSLVAPVLCSLLLLVSCKKDEEKPIPQQDSVVTTPEVAPSTNGERVPPAPAPAAAPDTTVSSAPRPLPAPPKEKGDTYPEYFLGMEGKFGKEIPSDGAPALLTAVRTARHEMFDRIVFEFDAARPPGYEVGYLDEPATACGSGKTVRAQGRAVLQLRIFHANAHTDDGQPTIKEMEYRLPSYSVLKEIKRTCDFEGTVTYIVGVTSRNKLRLLELRDPSRLVIDIRNDKALPDEFKKQQ
jgi:hypothetical protein